MADEVEIENQEAKVHTMAFGGEKPPSDHRVHHRPRRKYPGVVGLVVLSHVLNCFASFGVKALVYIYLKNFVRFDGDTATALFHAFTSAVAFLPVVASLLDGWMGLYRTVLCLSLVYNLGHLALAATSVRPLGAPNAAGAIVSLALISFSGAIEHGLNSFSGAQFHSYQKRHFERFYSVLYICMNLGCFLGSAVLPVLRKDVKCYGDDCYPLVFGVAGLLVLLAFVAFLVGTPFYRRERRKTHGHNIVIDMVRCMSNGLSNRLKRAFVSSATSPGDDEKPTAPRSHWIDHADETKFARELKEDIKAFCRVMFVFLPLPVFWAVYEQQESRWTDQAQQLDGRIGSWYILKPDQIRIVNPLVCVLVVPLLDALVFPLLRRRGLFVRYLQRMSAGLLLGIASFMFAAFLEWQMQKASARLNPAEQIRLLNLLPCRLELVDARRANSSSTPGLVLAMDPPDLYHNQAYQLPDDYVHQILSGSSNASFKLNGQCLDPLTNASYSLTDLDVQISAASPLSTVVFYSSSSNSSVNTYNLPFSKSNPPVGSSEIRFLKLPTALGELSPALSNRIISYNSFQLSQADLHVDLPRLPAYSSVDYNSYTLTVSQTDGTSVLETARDGVELETCGRYSVLLFANPTLNASIEETLDYVILADVRPNGIHLAWQAVQIALMALAEILFSISSMIFVYSQAPDSMRSLVHVCFVSTVGIGQLLVVLVVKTKFFADQAHEYLLFAVMLAASTLLFIALSLRYEYVQMTTQATEPNSRYQSLAHLSDIDGSYPHLDSLRMGVHGPTEVAEELEQCCRRREASTPPPPPAATEATEPVSS